MTIRNIITIFLSGMVMGSINYLDYLLQLKFKFLGLVSAIYIALFFGFTTVENLSLEYEVIRWTLLGLAALGMTWVLIKSLRKNIEDRREKNEEQDEKQNINLDK